jgi:hypothetical protein
MITKKMLWAINAWLGILWLYSFLINQQQIFALLRSI